MSQFIQLHMLTSYPPSNLNRDDMGRPKTAKMGGVDRLRISSQSLKRAWRTSDLFKSAVDGHMGKRTKNLGHTVFSKFVDAGIKEKDAKEWSKKIAVVFGKLKSEDKKKPEKNTDLEIEQLAHISPVEWDAVMKLVDVCSSNGCAPEDEALKLLRKPESAVDIALFGRMLASCPDKNMEMDAACQVSHAISVHPVVIEDDYFTAVDDLNEKNDDAGAAHIGERGFAAALFYTYICINNDLLIENLGGNEELANKTLKAFTETAIKVSPSGMQNSHASRAFASFVLAEKGDVQPRSLSVSFLKPIEGKNYIEDSIATLIKHQENMDKVYGNCAEDRKTINAIAGEGTMEELLTFVAN